MFCWLHKGFISRKQDTGNPLPFFTRRHTVHCTSCRSFSDFSESLHSRSDQDLAAILESAPRPRPVSLSGQAEGREGRTGVLHPRRRILRPALAALAAVVILSAALITGLIRRSDGTSLDQLAEWNKSLDSLEQRVLTSESPLEKEFLDLQNTVIQTTKFLRSRLDIRLD